MAVCERIRLGGHGELVDEALDHEGIVRDADAAPEAGVQDPFLMAHVLDLDRGDVVDQVHRPVERVAVEPVPKRRWQPTGQDRRTHEAVRPRDWPAARVQAGGDPVVVVGPVDVVLDVFLTAPNDFHGPVDLPRDAHGLGDVVDLQAAAEAAA